MKFREFCEVAASNDIICIVDDVFRGEPLKSSEPAFYFLLEDGDKRKPAWANDVLNKEVAHFTYGKIAKDYPHTHLIVELA
jgi:hypothetical protein